MVYPYKSHIRIFGVSLARLSFTEDYFNPDETWSLVRIFICGIVERNLAEIIADFPALFQLARRLRKKTAPPIIQEVTNASQGSIGNAMAGQPGLAFKDDKSSNVSFYGRLPPVGSER